MSGSSLTSELGFFFIKASILDYLCRFPFMKLSSLRCYGNEPRLPRKLPLVVVGLSEVTFGLDSCAWASAALEMCTCLTQAWLLTNVEKWTETLKDVHVCRYRKSILDLSTERERSRACHVESTALAPSTGISGNEIPLCSVCVTLTMEPLGCWTTVMEDWGKCSMICSTYRAWACPSWWELHSWLPQRCVRMVSSAIPSESQNKALSPLPSTSLQGVAPRPDPLICQSTLLCLEGRPAGWRQVITWLWLVDSAGILTPCGQNVWWNDSLCCPCVARGPSKSFRSMRAFAPCVSWNNV